MKNEPGLLFLQKLNMKQVKRSNQLISSVNKVLGIKDGMAFLMKYDSIRNSLSKEENRESVSDFSALYDLQNENLDLSLVYTGSFIADYLRSLFSWIEENRNMFGHEILDIGCHNGVTTCFLAQQFPDSVVLGIDRTANAIKVSKQLAERLGLKNVEFLQGDANELKDKQFDTVVSSRVLQENYVMFSHILEFSDPLNVLTEFCEVRLKRYAETISNLVKNEGTAIIAEIMGDTPLFSGWLQALNSVSLIPVEEKFKKYEGMELDEPRSIRMLVCGKGSPIKRETVYQMYERFLYQGVRNINGVPFDESRSGWYGNAWVYCQHEGLLYGFVGYANGIKQFKTAVWSLKNDPGYLLAEHYGNGNYGTKREPIGELAEWKKDYCRFIMDLVYQGVSVYKIAFENGKETRGEQVTGKEIIELSMS